MQKHPQILLGYFNSKCDSEVVSIIQTKSKMTLLNSAGIDCLFVKGISGKAKQIVAYPSEHPAIVAKLNIEWFAFSYLKIESIVAKVTVSINLTMGAKET